MRLGAPLRLLIVLLVLVLYWGVRTSTCVRRRARRYALCSLHQPATGATG
jgi:hypothetical protein